MNKKNNQKLLVVLICVLSVFSYIFVNSHAYCYAEKTSLNSLEMLKAKANEEEKGNKLTVPALSVIEQAIYVVQRFVPGN